MKPCVDDDPLAPQSDSQVHVRHQVSVNRLRHEWSELGYVDAGPSVDTDVQVVGLAGSPERPDPVAIPLPQVIGAAVCVEVDMVEPVLANRSDQVCQRALGTPP